MYPEKMLRLELGVSLFLLHICWTSGSITRPRYLRCYGYSMDKVLCAEGRHITVHYAFYADNGLVTGCNDVTTPDNLCTADISNVNSAYFEEIRQKCNGRRACKGLIAGKASTDCNGFFNPKTDYVLIEHTCDTVTTTTSTTTVTSPQTEVTSLSLSTSAVPVSGVTPVGNTTVVVTVPMGTPGPQAGDYSNLGVTVAIPILVILIIITVVLVILFLRHRRRRRPNLKGSGENGAAQTLYGNALYMTADSGDMIYDRAATVVLTAPEDTLPPYVDMNARSSSSADQKSGKRKMKLSWRRPSSKSKRSQTGTSNREATSKIPHSDNQAPAEATVSAATGQSTMEHQNPDRNRIYSLEKVPSEDRPESPDVYQSYDPYVEAGGLDDRLSGPPPTGNPQYVAMDGPQSRQGSSKESDPYSDVGQPTKLEDIEGVYSVPSEEPKTRVNRKESDPYTDVGQPSKLEDLEGVYSMPRNSGKVCFLTDETLELPRSPGDAPNSPLPYENIYQGTGILRDPTKTQPTGRPQPRRRGQSAEYSEVGAVIPRAESSEYSEVGAVRPRAQSSEYSEVAPVRPTPIEVQYGNIDSTRRPAESTSSTLLVDNLLYEQ